jgi:urea transporter
VTVLTQSHNFKSVIIQFFREGAWFLDPISGILNFVFNGVGQVFFMGSPLVGIIFVIALAINSRRAAAFAIIGSIAGGLVGLALGIEIIPASLSSPDNALAYGIFGFNSVLTAIALGDTFLEKGRAATTAAFIGALVTGFITASLIWFTRAFGLPVETSAFVLTTWIFLFAAHKFANMKLAGPPPAPKQRSVMLKNPIDVDKKEPLRLNEFTAGGFVKLIFTGIAQVMFQENWKTGVLFFIGLTVASVSLTPYGFPAQYPIYFAGITAFIGTLSATVAAIAFKGDRSSILIGLYGFNGTLTALAVMGVFVGFLWPISPFNGSWVNFFVMLFATAFSSVVSAFIGTITSRFSLPYLTAPFVFTSWLIELGAHVFPNIAPAQILLLTHGSIPAVLPTFTHLLSLL